MQLLKLRYFQLRRDLGYWLLIIAGAAFYVFQEAASVSAMHGLALTALVLLFLASYQLGRKDLTFIGHYLQKPGLQVLAGYNLLLLPLSAALAVNGYWLYLAALHLLASGISFLRPKAGTQRLAFISRLVPAEQFEWISGLRKSFYLLLLLLVPALVLSPVKLFGLAALFMINTVFLGFYQVSEPLLMLNPLNLTPQEFLRRKTAFFVKVLLLTNGPLLLVNSLFQQDSAWFNLCFLFAFMLLGACSVYIKYAHYRPNESQRVNADLLILFASVFLPYFLPLSVLLYFSNRKKAIANLMHYQYDHS